MQILYAPYHLDQHLPDLRVPLPPGADVTEVTASLPSGSVWDRMVALYSALASAAAEPGPLPPVVVSGDCTLSLGLVAGLQRSGVSPGIVWFDAHGDLQTLETSASGYLGGTALRLLLGYRRSQLADRLGLEPPAEDRVVLVDARDLDPPEVDFLATSAVRRLPAAGLSAADLPAGPLLLNLDLDVVDPVALPGARFPAPAGPDTSVVLETTRTILATGRTVAFNLACTWDPGRPDLDQARGDLIAALLDLT